MNRNTRIKTTSGLIFIFCAIGLVAAGFYIWPKVKPWFFKKNNPKIIHEAGQPITTEKEKEPPIPAPIKFFIKVKAENNGDYAVSVSGDSNLPNNSQIDIRAYRLYTTLEDSSNYEGALGSAKTTLFNGKFSATIKLNDDRQWYDSVVNFYKIINYDIQPDIATEYNFKSINDYITIDASLHPEKQTDAIQKIIGSNGEKLTGDNLYEDKNGIKFIKGQFKLPSLFPYAKTVK